MLAAEDVVAEWARVKDEKSLLQHYGRKSYQRWRYNFIKYGLIERTTRRFVKNRVDQKERRRDYCREYSKAWRSRNRHRTEEYLIRYWKRKLADPI